MAGQDGIVSSSETERGSQLSARGKAAFVRETTIIISFESKLFYICSFFVIFSFHCIYYELFQTNIVMSSQEKSIELYDDQYEWISRNTILTRSARIRKFKFYQFKKVQSPQSPGPLLLPRGDVLNGEISSIPEPKEDEIDRQISEIEKKIADVKGDDNLDQILDLVHQKDDLLRRQMRLNIIEQEKVLEKAHDELIKELRSLMNIDDSSKTSEQLERQQYLYDKSLALVNKRNELVLHMDVQEKSIDDDNAVKAKLKHVKSNRSEEQESCCIQ